MAASITCPRCGMTSYHPRDIQERYCGNCHQFHEFMGPLCRCPPGECWLHPGQKTCWLRDGYLKGLRTAT